MKPYQRIPIVECREPLVPIPTHQFAIRDPHPYIKLGAPYGDKSPYYLRQSVLTGLITAQLFLQQRHPDWRIQIFDAYRPIAVQQFMVDHVFNEAVRSRGLNSNNLSQSQRQEILEQVDQFWAAPSFDPKTPPPHSTGAAVDVTLVDAEGQVIDMGSPIDELSTRSYPDYFASSSNLVDEMDSTNAGMTRDRAIFFHSHRQLLRDVMVKAGFRQHSSEWWHFSIGDQMWAWSLNQERPETMLVARYGAIQFYSVQ
jgi:zinc D-Ala-D-Ala dipeptidase